MKPKDAFKLSIVKLDKSGKYLEVNVLSEDGLCKYLHQRGEQHREQNNGL